MLLRFRAENHRSLRKEQTLSLVALDESPVTRDLGWGDLLVLPAAGIYGPNGSGKSNVLGALDFLRGAVLTSHTQWDPDGGVPRQRFALDDNLDAPSTYEIDFFSDGTRYQYGFSVDDAQVLQEWLYAYPSNRRQVWFERDTTAAAPFSFSRLLGGEKRVIERLTRPNSLYLSTAAQNNHEQLRVVHRWIAQRLRLRLGEASPFRADRVLARLIARAEDPERLLQLIRFADLGIEDVHMIVSVPPDPADTIGEDDGEPSSSRRRPQLPDRRVEFVHTSASGARPLPFATESRGTRAWAQLLGPLLDVLDEGSVLVVDELDASLHPMLVGELLGLFQDPTLNTRGAQLVFTTHDTTLLSPRLPWRLQRDQVWLTEKAPDGATELYPLVDYKVRTDDNYERGYLNGRYGALPFLEQSILAQLAPDAHDGS